MTLCGKLAGSYSICYARNNCKCAPDARHQAPVKHHRVSNCPTGSSRYAGRRSPTPPARCPCGSIRARRRARYVVSDRWLQLCREGAFGRKTLSLEQAAFGASGRRLPSRGAGGRLRKAGLRTEPALSTPLRGGRRSRPQLGAGAPTNRRVATVRRCDLSSPKTAQCSHQLHACLRPWAISFEPKSMSDSSPKRMSEKRGLGGFRVQLRHANAWRVVRENCQAHTPQGSRCKAARGWFPAAF
jgi:hypothetical protein